MRNNRFADNGKLLEAAAGGDSAAREELILKNMGLVYSVVKRFLGRGYETEDLIQIGSIGLIRAAERFDTGFGVRFSTYAVPMIIGEIKRFIRDDGIIKVSRTLKDTAANAARIKADIEKREAREATVAEIAERLNISAAELSAALDSQQQPFSLYSRTDDGNGEGKALVDKLEREDSPVDDMLDKITVRGLIDGLDERDREIIIQRFYGQKTQAQIAERLGISQVQVSRLEKKILKKLRGNLTEE